MAFLNFVPSRPSCVVSALPNRFRTALEKNLSGSVAISSCRVEQLENAVRLRGATIVVVGASDASLEIAERLSHSAENVKVFLVHYQDSLASKAVTNGFAGIFDLRSEQEGLTESIRQEALHPSRPARRAARSKSEQRQIIEHFIAMSTRLSHPGLLNEYMLEGFLKLAQVPSGALLLPVEDQSSQFQIAASREIGIEEGEQICLSEEIILEMLKGDILFLPGGLFDAGGFPLAMAPQFYIGVPLISGKELLGCLIASTNEATESLADYSLAATHMLALVQHQKQTARREKLISNVKSQFNPSWLLVDAKGRMIHRESNGRQITTEGAQAMPARLKHAIAEAQAGRSALEHCRGFLISANPHTTSDGTYAVVQLIENKQPLMKAVSRPKLDAKALEFIQTHLGDTPKRETSVRYILKGTNPDGKYDAPELNELGIQVTSGWELVPTASRGHFVLLLLALANELKGQLRFSLSKTKTGWSLLFEQKEEAIEQELGTFPDVSARLLIQLIMRATGLEDAQPKWQSGSFGARLEWISASEC